MGLAINKTAEAVKNTILQLLKPYTPIVHTITYDNGPEFFKYQEINQSLNSTLIFAIPFHQENEA